MLRRRKNALILAIAGIQAGSSHHKIRSCLHCKRLASSVKKAGSNFMSNLSKTIATQSVFILAGSSSQYTDARRKLNLSPAQASWLTRPSNLEGKHRPQIYRFGDWKSLAKIQEIEAAMAAAEAEVVDL